MQRVKQALRVPIVAVVSDGQRSIRKAVQQALPQTPHQLCHFHDLREAAKPIYKADRKVTHSYWSGLFHWYHRADLPRTNNDLEQFFGAHRYHKRRATGRKGASPTLVLRSMVRMTACAATRLCPDTGEELAPDNLQEWKALRHQLESRRQQRVHRSRFRRHPDAYPQP